MPRVNTSVINNDDERIVEKVVKAMAKLQTKTTKTNTVTFAENDTPPINAYNTTPANFVNPENATGEVARLRQELKYLKLRLSKQQTENQATPQNNHSIPQNQPTCYKCHNVDHIARKSVTPGFLYPITHPANFLTADLLGETAIITTTTTTTP